MDPIKNQLAQIANKYSKPNTAAPTLISNDRNAQQYEGLPISQDTLNNGTLSDLSYTTEGYMGQIGKNVGRALINTVGFAAGTIAAIPNIIDNQFNDGEDRVIKPIEEFQKVALNNIVTHQNKNDESMSGHLLPSWYTGNTTSFWGDLIEQSGIIAGTTLGMGAVMGAARAIPGISALSGVTSNAIKGALSNLTKSSTLLGELGASSRIINTINGQKFVNGLASAAKLQGINAVQSYTEALFEGLDGERNFVEKSIADYTDKYGEEPTGSILAEIKQAGENLKNDRFGLNMVGLMISNTPFTKAFFGEAAPSFLQRTAEKGLSYEKGGKLVFNDKFKDLPKYLNKPLNVAARAPLAVSEGLEEVYQLGLEKGLDNYYTNKINTENFEANFENVSKAIGVGFKDGVFSKEGLKAFITGAGVGGVFQGIGSIKDYKQMQKYLKEEVITDYERDNNGNFDLTKPIKKTNQAVLDEDLDEADKVVTDLFNNKNNIALNQTFGEKLQQFNNDSQIAEALTKSEGTYFHYDATQEAKFNAIMPYALKGYSEVLQNKVEAQYEEWKKANPSRTEEENKVKADQLTSALQDIKTVDKFVKDVDNVFNEKFTDSFSNTAQRQLKNVAAYHLWNINSITKQQEFLKNTIGSSLYEKTKSFNGINYKQEVKKLLDMYPEGIEAYEQKRKELNNINSAQEYLDYLQKDIPGIKLTVPDYQKLKKQNDFLKNRLKNNNETLTALANVKSDPLLAIKVLNDMYEKASKINKEVRKKEAEVETKVVNKETVEKIDPTATEEEKEKAVEALNQKSSEVPATPLDAKIEVAEVKKKEKVEEENVNKFTEVFNNMLDGILSEEPFSVAAAITILDPEYKNQFLISYMGSLINISEEDNQLEDINAYVVQMLNFIKSLNIDFQPSVIDVSKAREEFDKGGELKDIIANYFKQYLETYKEYNSKETNVEQKDSLESKKADIKRRRQELEKLSGKSPEALLEDVFESIRFRLQNPSNEEALIRIKNQIKNNFVEFIGEDLSPSIGDKIKNLLLPDFLKKYPELISDLSNGTAKTTFYIDLGKSLIELVNLSKINAKYDAELAALKEVVTEKTPVEETIDLNKRNEILGVLESFISLSKAATSTGDIYNILGKIYRRVSRVTNPEGLVFKGVKNVSQVKNSTVVGNFIDVLSRELFKNSNTTFEEFNTAIKLDKPEEYAQYSKIMSKDVFDQFKKDMLIVKEKLIKRHTINGVEPVIISDEILIKYDTKNLKGYDGVAGTTDVIIVDAKGDYFIYDYKNKTENSNTVDFKSIQKDWGDGSNDQKWTAQQSIYAKMLETYFGKKPKSLNAIVIPVTYGLDEYSGNNVPEETDLFKPTPFNLKRTSTNVFFYPLEYNLKKEIEDIFTKPEKPSSKIITKQVRSKASSKTIADFQLDSEGKRITKESTITIDPKKPLSVTSFVLEKEAESRLAYDNALIRTTLHNGAKEIYNIFSGESFMFSIQNNKQNFLIDLNLVRNFANQNKENFAALYSFVQKLPKDSTIPFVDFLEELLFDEDNIEEQSKEEIFQQFQNNRVTLTSDVDFLNSTNEKGVEYQAGVGSVLNLFNFPSETLKDLHRRFNTENTLYEEIRKNPKTISDVLLSKLNITYQNSRPQEVSEIPLSESNHIPNSAFFIFRDSEGNYDMRGEYVSVNTEQGLANRLRIESIIKNQTQEFGGYYIAFKDGDNSILIRGVKTSGKYAELENPNLFRVGINFTNSKGNPGNKYYDVIKDDKGFNVKAIDSNKTEVLSTIEDVEAYISKNREKPTISYFEKEKNNLTFEYIYKKGRIDMKSFINTKAVVTPGTTTVEINEPTEETPSAPVRDDVDLNQTEDVNIVIKLNVGDITINKVTKYEDKNYTLNEGVTEEQLKEAVKKGGKSFDSKQNYLFNESGLFAGTPSFSTISDTQLSIIKEFTKQC